MSILPFLLSILFFSLPLQASPVPSLLACKQREIGLCGPPSKNPPPDNVRHSLLVASLVITGLSLGLYVWSKRH